MGWREREKVERIGEILEMLGVDSRTPGYMVRENMQRR